MFNNFTQCTWESRRTEYVSKIPLQELTMPSQIIFVAILLQRANSFLDLTKVMRAMIFKQYGYTCNHLLDTHAITCWIQMQSPAAFSIQSHLSRLL